MPTALTFVLTLEDARRFNMSRQVGPALGLVPKRDQSGDKHPQPGITKTGNAYLRQLLVSAAHYILGPSGPDCDLRRWGLKLVDRGGKYPNKRAAVAVATKLAVLMHRLWKTGGCTIPSTNRQANPPMRLARLRRIEREDPWFKKLVKGDHTGSLSTRSLQPTPRPGDCDERLGRLRPDAASEMAAPLWFLGPARQDRRTPTGTGLSQIAHQGCEWKWGESAGLEETDPSGRRRGSGFTVHESPCRPRLPMEVVRRRKTRRLLPLKAPCPFATG